MSFINEDFMLKSETAKELYEKVIRFSKNLEMATNNYQIYSYIGKEKMQKFARDSNFGPR